MRRDDRLSWEDAVCTIPGARTIDAVSPDVETQSAKSAAGRADSTSREDAIRAGENGGAGERFASLHGGHPRTWAWVSSCLP